MRTFWRNNGLSVVLFGAFLGLLTGQSLAGHRHYNDEQRGHGQPEIGYGEYVRGPEFLEATGENWESEFLQMAAYVSLTVFLFQRGSVESKDPDKTDPVDRKPDPARRGAPGPVRRGGIALTLYRNSLSLAFLALFLLSFVIHAIGGAAEYNEERLVHRQPGRLSVLEYMGTARFWFESLQNWQSEFLALGSMVVLTIFLRQHGSPESKPVDAPHSQTGHE
jgi:hypothetical protein